MLYTSETFPLADKRVSHQSRSLVGKAPPPTGELTVTVVRYYDALLDLAVRLIDEGSTQPYKYSIAVIVSQTSCEVFTARMFGIIHRNTNTEWFADTDLIRDYDINNDRLIRVYFSLA